MLGTRVGGPVVTPPVNGDVASPNTTDIPTAGNEPIGTVTDAGALARAETGVTDTNEAPTDITVAGGSVAENAAAGTVVATLGATDPDAGSTFTYTLSSDPPASSRSSATKSG